MQDKVYLGTLPADEEFPEKMATHKLCQLWREELRSAWKRANPASPLPVKCKLVIESQGHELGDYYEVVAVFDDADEHAASAAYWLEAHTPQKWSHDNVIKFQSLIRSLT